MGIKDLNFNHGASCIHESMGIDPSFYTKCREKIIFHIYAGRMAVVDNYDNDMEAAPPELRSVSGNLQRVLNNAESQLEAEIMLFLFQNTHSVCVQAFSLYMNSEGPIATDESKLKVAMLLLGKKIEDAKRVSNQDENPEADLIAKFYDIEKMMERVKLVKKSNYNFDTYYNLLSINQMNPAGDVTSIEDLINSAFRDDD